MLDRRLVVVRLLAGDVASSRQRVPDLGHVLVFPNLDRVWLLTVLDGVGAGY